MGDEVVHALCLLGFTAAGVVALVSWWRDRERRINRALAAMPVREIRAFPDGGTGRIVGRVEPSGPPLVAPLSRRRCAYYHVLVEEDGGRTWRHVLGEARGVDFYLRDGTGRARIRVDLAEVAVVRDHTVTSGFLDDATELERQLLQRHGQEATGLVFNRKLRYREGILALDELVAAGGVGRRAPAPDPDRGAAPVSYRDPPQELVMASTPAQRLLVSDALPALAPKKHPS